MDFIETVSALMNATPGRDLCWLLTRHPEKPEYHVVLCVRQEYFDGPELDRLILDAWVTCWVSRHQVKQSRTRSRSPGMWYWIAGHRTAKPCLRTLSGRSVISPAIAVECAIRKPVASPVIPVGSAESSIPSHTSYYPILHQSHRGYSDHVDHNKPRQRVAACRRSPDRHELHHQFHRHDR